MHLAKSLVLLTVSGVTLAGVGVVAYGSLSSSPEIAGAQGAVTTTPLTAAAPTTSTIISPTSTSVPNAAGPSCSAGSLSLSLPYVNGAAGNLYHIFKLTNTGSVACSLDGVPSVSVESTTGQAIEPTPTETAAQGLEASPVTIAPGAFATFWADFMVCTDSTLVQPTMSTLDYAVQLPSTEGNVLTPFRPTLGDICDQQRLVVSPVVSGFVPLPGFGPTPTTVGERWVGPPITLRPGASYVAPSSSSGASGTVSNAAVPLMGNQMVPDLIGLTLADAEAKLSVLGTEPGGATFTVNGPSSPTDTVTAQSPSPGSSLPSGAVVLSTGSS
jgi:Protein of unknown function (DUF4232)/PASTA domain